MQPATTSRYRVFGTAASGNCHKVRLALDLLGASYAWEEIDVMTGATRAASFLAMNPNGKVPVLEFAPGQYLAESNAILCFLSEGTPLWPGDRLARAQALQWLFFEQYSHEPYIAVARFIRSFAGRADDPRLPELERRGNLALAVMEQHLQTRPFFVGPGASIADLALFAYTCRADEGGFDLDRYPAVGAWLRRVGALPGVSLTPAAPLRVAAVA